MNRRVLVLPSARIAPINKNWWSRTARPITGGVQPRRASTQKHRPASAAAAAPHLSRSLTWFPALRCRCRIRSHIRFRSRFRNRFRKNRVRTCRLFRCCWGVCAAITRQAQEAGRRVSRAKEWAEIQTHTNSRCGKIELDPI